ncbi:MAG: Sigma-70 region 2 [Pyrinomonadaceae bacterium]|jgi:RNA polymerase sigma factor (sigma-70 family)|nr:Sigma-70 region 2 [Pyrinomonadaceae bacterium]
MSVELTESQRRDAWAKLSVDLYPRLFAMARSLTRNDVDFTEDLVQQTILRCLKYAPDLARIAEPTSYLRRLMRNTWIDSVRKHNEISLDDPSISALPETAMPSEEPNILRLLENEQLRENLMLNQGPLTTYEIRLLRLRLEGYTHDEIASLLREDVRVTRCNSNALMAKIRYRIQQKIKGKTAK